MTSEGDIYLPPIGDSNKEYIKDIITGKKKFIYCKNIHSIKVPHIKSLSIKEILVFARENTKIDDYLPTYKYSKFPDREWLCNIINAIANKQFREFIDEAMRNREKMIVNKMRLKVDAIPEILSIFSKSKNVSYMNGRTHFLLRSTQKGIKRKYNDIEMDRKEEEDRAIDRFKSKIKDLENEIDEYKSREDLLLQDKEKLVILYQNGYIDSDGEQINKK